MSTERGISHRPSRAASIALPGDAVCSALSRARCGSAATVSAG